MGVGKERRRITEKDKILSWKDNLLKEREDGGENFTLHIKGIVYHNLHFETKEIVYKCLDFSLASTCHS